MKKYIIVLTFLFSIFACSDIVEEDITKRSIQVLSPIDNYNAESTTVNFLWNYVEGADEYQVEIVRGGFNNVLSFAVDTFLDINQFTYNFNPGEYQWSIRAVNSEYSTEYFTRSFRVDSISNISQSSVLLSFPEQDEFYGDSSLTLSWQSVFSATSYIVLVKNANNGNFVVMDTTTTNFYTTGNVLTNAPHEWQVKALNDQSETPFSTSTFTVDLIQPGTPALLKPNNQLSPAIDRAVEFSWRSGLDTNWDFDSIYIYETTVSSSPLIVEKMVGTTFTDSSFTTGGVYKWRVKSFDKANNSSQFSAEGEFSIQ